MSRIVVVECEINHIIDWSDRREMCTINGKSGCNERELRIKVGTGNQREFKRMKRKYKQWKGNADGQSEMLVEKYRKIGLKWKMRNRRSNGKMHATKRKCR